MSAVNLPPANPTAGSGALDEQVEALAGEVLHLLRVDPRLALATADRMLQLAGREPRLAARATWSRAHALVNLGRHAEASEHYRKAATAYRALGESLLAARTGLGHVDTLMRRGRYAEAMTVGKAARATLVRHRDLRSVVRLDTNLANILHRTDRPMLALRAYDRARRGANQLGDEPGARLIQFNRANVLTSLGRHAEAEVDYLVVRSGAEAAGESRVVALVDYSLGYLQLQRSDYGGAFATLELARSAFEGLSDHDYLAPCHLDLAELLLEINAFPRARQHARRARMLYEQQGLRYESGKATLFLAMSELGAGEDARARELMAEAAAIFRREGNAVYASLCDLYRGELARRAGQSEVADRAFARAEECFTAEKFTLRAAAAALRRGSLAIGRGDTGEAAEHLGRARRLMRRRRSPWLLAQHDHLVGRMHMAAGKPELARRHVRRAVGRIEQVRRRISLDEFRLSYAADKAPVYADLVDLTLGTKAGPAQVREAFGIVEQSRSRALVDLLAGRLGAATGRVDPGAKKLLSRIEKLRGEVNWLAGSGENERGRRDERLIEADRAEIESREMEIADLMQRLAHRDRRLGALAEGETITLEEVQAALAGDTVLVEYFLTGELARAFVVTRGQARVVELAASPRQITAAIERLRFHIEKWGYGDDYGRAREALMAAGTRAHLDRLADLVWRPLAVDAERLIIVPHGVLHSLPFHALPFSMGDECLIDRSEVSYLPSASTLRYLRRNGAMANDGADPSVLVVGVEDERIPKVEEEIARVRGLFARGQVLRAGEARIADFRSQAAAADYVHVAAHGIFREDDPHFSALRLADGWLSVYDLYGLDLKARLVSLSACQSGRSWVGGGDELVGLVRGFLHAGARSLLVSLWPVHDATTAQLMAVFYGALRAGSPPAAALRQAMDEVRAEHPHPYHWAPFVWIGWPEQEQESATRPKSGRAG
jgi:CHAT domain-containing protein